jgi:hypothetical protein
VLSSTDCDDRNAAIRPDADEICDALDNDCDGLRNDDDPSLVDAPVWYLDQDGDSYGQLSATRGACRQPDGYADRAGDCNDFEEILNPETRWWRDADRDGFGDDLLPLPAPSCEIVPGYVTTDGDCDDSDFSIHSGTGWFPDADGDGQGTGIDFVAFGCQTAPGIALTSGDCDDTDPADVGGLCYGPSLGLLAIRIQNDDDGGGQSVIVQCGGQPIFERDLRATEAGDEILLELQYPTGTQCRIQIDGPTLDLSGDGAASLGWQMCGVVGGTLDGRVGQTVTSSPIEATRCSGCTDPAAINFDPTALIDTGVCLY